MSRWRNWSRGLEDKPRFITSFIKEAEVDMGNPAVGSSPAERARQMGLQSNGSGGYVDPETGQVIARTVNGELVFYDNRGMGGGAVSDGAGGADLANAQPSWTDPMTGLAITPPSRPESPEEQGSVPDPIPAAAPAGYNNFINNTKKDMYRQQAMQKNATADENNPLPAAPLPGINPIQADGTVDIGPGVSEGLGDNKEMRAITGDLPPKPTDFAGLRKKMQASMPEQPPAEQPNRFAPMIDRMLAKGERKRGAGAKRMSHDDLNALKGYIQNGPQNIRTEMSDDEFSQAQEYLNTKLKGKTKTFYDRMMKKGTPPKDLYTDQRGLDVLRSYLEYGGKSALDNEDLLFSESELDHGESLDAGGTDSSDNWRWLPRRFNGYKSNLNDDDLMAKIDKDLARDPMEQEIRVDEDDLTNLTRQDWMKRFKENGWSDLNVADIDQASGKLGIQFLKGLAEISGTSRYKVNPDKNARQPTTALKPEELRKKLIDELGIPTNVDVMDFDRGLFETLQRIEDARSDLDSKKRAFKTSKKE